MLLRWVFAWLSLFGTGGLMADNQEALIPRQLLFGNPQKTSPLISPDGSKIGYLAPDQNDVLNVWIKDLKEKKEDQLVTSDKKRGIRSFLWQYDNVHILYIQDLDGDENWHLYQTNILTKETKNLTPFKGSRVDIVDYDHQFPDEILVQINQRDPALFDVYRINLKTADVKLDTENKDSVFHWVTDNEMKIRASCAYDKEGSTIVRVRDSIDSPWRELLVIKPEEIGGDVIGFSPSNDAIYLLSSLEGNTVRLLKKSLNSPLLQVISENSEYDLASCLRHPTTYELEAIGLEKEKQQWIPLNESIQKDFDKIRANGIEVFTITSRTLSNQKWIIASISDLRPVHYYLYDRQSGKAEFLFNSQPALEKFSFSQMSPITYQARDGMVLHGYLSLPKGKDQKKLSTVIMVHGGPWVRDSWGFKPGVQWLTDRGYAVLQINYRGSTGYGKDYLNAGNKEWAGKMHTDLLDGKKWMIEKGIADPNKVAIYGGSYGGYATLVGLTFTPDEFCCGVDVVGPSNLITLLKTLPTYWGPLKASIHRRIGSLEEEAFLISKSPLHKVDAIKKPLMIGQGANDPRVKQSESDQIVEAMRKKGLPVEYLVFTDEGHGFARPENRLKFYAAMESFLAKYLNGRIEQPKNEENWESHKR